MRFTYRISALLLAVLLLPACSRAGFAASLDKKNPASSGSAAVSSSESAAESSQLVFDLDIGELSENGCYYYYVLPRGMTGRADETATAISEKIHSTVLSLPGVIAAEKSIYSLTVYDAVTKNDGSIFSICYEIKYQAEKGGAKELYSFGLAFDPASGTIKSLSSLIDPNVLTTLLLDEQSSRISEKDEALAAKKRAYLNELGAQGIIDRLSYDNSGLPAEKLLDASYYVDGAKLTVVLAAPQDIGGVVEVSVNL